MSKIHTEYKFAILYIFVIQIKRMDFNVFDAYITDLPLYNTNLRV